MKSMKRRIKDRLQSGFFSFYRLGVRVGIHVLPDHYYIPIANVIELERTRARWAKASEMPGVVSDLDEQVANLKRVCLPYQGEYAGNKTYQEGVTRQFGPGFGYIEAQALHGVVRHFKPARVVEVGSGVSTLCTWTACGMNQAETGQVCEITCIEPHPSLALSQLGDIRLIASDVQNLGLEAFLRLRARDLLFIDSSHTVKPSGDVSHLILEVLPRLAEGVLVHFHDIYLPYDYQRDLLKTFMQRMETPLLRAFLTFNDRTRILFCLSHLHYERTGDLKQVFPEYEPQPGRDGMRELSFDPARHFPSSIYLRM